MKNSSSAKKCKKKRKAQPQLKLKKALTDYNRFRNALPKAWNLRPRNPSSIKHALLHLNYKFKVTPSIKRNIHAIKRTIINESVVKVQNTNRISINDRIGNTGSSEVFEKFDLRCSSKFLEGRFFKMANSSENSNDSFRKVSITFEQMLSIRKKRLDQKHRRPCQKTDLVVEVVDDGDATVCKNEQNDCFEVVNLKEINQNHDVIEIKDDSNIIGCENNNMEKSCGIKYYVDQTEENKDAKQVDGTNLTPEISSHVERIDPNTSHEVVNSIEAVIDLDLFTINDPLINTRLSEIPSEETLNKMSIDDGDQSVIIVTPNENDVPNPQFDSKKRLTRWSSANSVIAISDTSGLCHNISDDIIFISEECRSTITPSVKKRRLGRKPSVVIIDDDDSRLSVSRRNTNCSRKRKPRKRIKKKKRGSNVTQSSANAAFTSELASCADVHCINTRNCNQAATSQTAQSCACQQSRGACSLTPHLLTIPEQSATIAQNNRDSRESTKGLYVQNNPLHLNRMNNKFGSNIHNAGCVVREGLRQIIIDGSNIALGHSNGTVFSIKGLQIAIDYFIKKGHIVKAFVPQYRLKFGQCTNPNFLRKLIDERLVILTPSREVKGRRITPYDDRYIIQYATTCEGIVVSNDNFRDLLEEKPEWRQTIERRLLMYTWVDDILIFPEDPLGRHGPNLSRFLRFP